MKILGGQSIGASSSSFSLPGQPILILPVFFTRLSLFAAFMFLVLFDVFIDAFMAVLIVYTSVFILFKIPVASAFYALLLSSHCLVLTE